MHENSPRADRSRLAGAGVAPLLLLGCLTLGWLGTADPARAESGTVHRARGKGLDLTVDTRWVDGSGYRPVRIAVSPLATTVADRELRIQISVENSSYGSTERTTVEQYVEIPAGTTSTQTVEATIAVPQMDSYDGYSVVVLENGKAIKPFVFGGGRSAIQSYQASQRDRYPAVLIIASNGAATTNGPDTTNLAGLLPADELSGYGIGVMAGPSGTRVIFPTSIFLPIAELPQRWIDYSSLDVVCVPFQQLAKLAATRPQAFHALVDWTASGGNLLVSGIGTQWERLAELETLLEWPAESQTAQGQASRPPGWSEPQRHLHGQRLRGVGPNAPGPFDEIPSQESMRSYGPYGQTTSTSDEASKPIRPKVQPTGPPQEAPFLLRELQMGMVVAVAGDDLFQQSSADWAWILNSLGSERFLWYQRHGVSTVRPNPEFMQFLIPGVGLAPVAAFCVLITFFVLAIGPLNYWFFLRVKRLHLIVVTVPLSAALVTGALFGYALISDGLHTRSRARTVTEIDQRRKTAVCWSRLSYYAGLAPGRGLTFPADVVVVPYDRSPWDNGARSRHVLWEDQQHFTRGWLKSRTPTQLLTLRCRPTDLQLIIEPGPSDADGPDRITVTNRLNARIKQLLVRTKHGDFYWTTDLENGAAGQAQSIELADALTELKSAYSAARTSYPAGYDYSTDYTNRSYRRGWYYNQETELPDSSHRAGRLESRLGVLGMSPAAAAKAIRPGSYVAVVDESPEVELGTRAVGQESDLHLILGTW